MTRHTVGSLARTPYHSRPVDIYPVGVLRDLIDAKNAARTGRWGHARWAVRRAVQTALRNVKRRKWRELRQHLLNGYLAEPREWPLRLRRCGSGWTRARALRDLQRRVRRAERRAGR